jgi:hypothetical protein
MKKLFKFYIYLFNIKKLDIFFLKKKNKKEKMRIKYLFFVISILFFISFSVN